MQLDVLGKLRVNADLSKTNWFQVGGDADLLFRPKDVADLQSFLKQIPSEMNVTTIGVGSNLLVRDGGVRGVVIKLGRAFNFIESAGDKSLHVGAAVLSANLAKAAAKSEIAGMSFLVGIPGTIGGAIAMNAGAYGFEVKDCLISARAIDRQGKLHEFDVADFKYSYRHHELGNDLIFIDGVFAGDLGVQSVLEAEMQEISAKREATQPIKTRTSGSTFVNPKGHSSWRLIDEAGLRGFRVGGAKISEKHCNFIENDDNATASDIEELINIVKAKVKEKFDIDLRVEIEIIGEK